MYEIWSSAGLIRHPLIMEDDRTVTAGKLSLELNKAGSLAFTMPPVHHCFDEMPKLSTECWVVRDGEEIFRGRVLYSDRNLINQREIFCEGLRVLLNDEYLRPGDLSSNGTYSGTAAGLIDLFCAAYNARQPDAVPFARGTVNISGTVTVEAKDWQTIGEALDKAVEMYGGFVFVRRVNGQNLIDWTLDSGVAGEQQIRFGDNLLTLQEHVTGEDVFTVVIPLGKDRGEGAGRLTIEQAAASGGKDYIENTDAIAALGVRIAKVVTFDDIDDPDVLYTAGAAVFQQGGGVLTSMELSVVDLHDAGVDVERLRLGNCYSVDSPPHSIHLQMPLTKMDIDLLRPDYSSAFTFGIQMNGMVQRQNTMVKQVAATAESAKKTANAAATTAQQANTTAVAASETAAQAKQAADAAASAADVAAVAATAQAAMAAASDAADDATAAVSAAQAAQTTAGNAQTAAGNAASAAATAQTTANAASQAAGNAQSTADTARTEAAAADTKATAAQTAANNAASAAASAQSTANTANSNAAAALTKTNAIVDYIQETGTSGIWTYEKWASGKAVCWGVSKLSVSANGWNGSGSTYYINGSAAFPTGLFTGVPELWVHPGNDSLGGNLFIYAAKHEPSTAATAKYRLMRTSNFGQAVIIDVNLHAIGIWK